MEAPARPVVVGELIGVHGVRGAFKMRSYCDPPERIFRYRNILLRRGSELKLLVVRSRKPSKDDFIIEIEGVEDRNSTVPWLGAELIVDRSQLPRARPGEYYWTDLEGLQVRNNDGSDYGRVLRLFNTGANDVIVASDGERERLIPFVMDTHVLQVDLVAGVITVQWDPEF